MATTFETIRDAQIAVIQALTPSVRADRLFIKHREGDYMSWVEAHPTACWRRFQIVHNLDIDQGPTADGSIEACTHTEELRIAYPMELGKYGADNERDLEDMLASDFHQIDAAIGLNGLANYVTNQDRCQHLPGEPKVIDVEGARVLSITYLVQYDRSV